YRDVEENLQMRRLARDRRPGRKRAGRGCCRARPRRCRIFLGWLLSLLFRALCRLFRADRCNWQVLLRAPGERNAEQLGDAGAAIVVDSVEPGSDQLGVVLAPALGYAAAVGIAA